MDSASAVEKPMGDPDYVQPAHEAVGERYNAVPASDVAEKHTGGDAHKMDSETDMSANHSMEKEDQHDAHITEGGDKEATDAPAEQSKGGPPGDVEQTRSRGRVVLIMFALGMAVFLAALDITIITTALPTIADHFHSASGYTWVGAAYQLASAAATPIWGKISDIWGRKPTLLIANIIFFIGSLIAALSVNIGMLIVARAIQGLGGGGLLVLVNITIGDLFSMRSRGAYYGIIGMVWAIASALGPIIGGAFTDKVSWRWCFYVNLPLDGLAFVIILFFLDLETPTTAFMEGIKYIDWIGAITIVGGTVMLLLGLEFGGVSFGWSSATVICLLVFGVLLIAAFFIHEWKFAKYPIMPMRIFKFRSNCAALLTAFLHAMVFISASYFLPLYFQTVLGRSPLMSGVLLLPICLALSFSSAATGIFIRKTGKYQPPIWFGMTLMLIGFGLLINLDADSGYGKIIGYQIVAGVGVGPNFQAPLIALQSLVPPRDIGSATSAFQFTRNLGVAISIVIGSVAFQNQMLDRSATLVRALGPRIAGAVGGNQAGANAPLINSLPSGQQRVIHVAIADSLRVDWIMYTVFAAVGLACSLLITKQTLSREHKTTKTGVEAEQERHQIAVEEKRAKRASKQGAAPKENGEAV